MHLLFADESGSPVPPAKVKTGDLFVLGALVVPEEVWHHLNRSVANLKMRYEVIGELKWRHFFNSRKGPLVHLDPATRDRFRDELYGLISGTKSLTCLAVIVDQHAAYQKSDINCIDDIYQRAYKILSERFQYFLQDLQRTSGISINGMLVLDNRGPRDDKLLQDFHSTLVAGNGSFTSKYNNFVEGLFIAPSHHSIGIQLADLVGGAVYRNATKGDSRFLDAIKDSFRKSPQGNIAGYGIARFPHR